VCAPDVALQCAPLPPAASCASAPRGVRVVLHSLRASPSLNGAAGTLLLPAPAPDAFAGGGDDDDEDCVPVRVRGRDGAFTVLRVRARNLALPLPVAGGAAIVLHGLVSAKHCNGGVARVLPRGVAAGGERDVLAVELPGGVVQVHARNCALPLRAADDAAPPRIILHGLVEHAFLNGVYGEVR
jgi:hypothetical protein